MFILFCLYTNVCYCARKFHPCFAFISTAPTMSSFRYILFISGVHNRGLALLLVCVVRTTLCIASVDCEINLRPKFRYPVLMTDQGVLHYFLTDEFNRTLSRLLCGTSSYAAINTPRIFLQRHPPCTARYSFIQLSELEQHRVNELVEGSTRQHMIRTRVLFMESPQL